ncbi:MAG TPA: DsbA family protein, partial [Bryobacteraceae bacterium]|nr:DsbA family protein [Bryobacteraceae bacterium]
RGPAGAPVTLEFFADLESPVSRPAMSVLDELQQRYPSTVRLQFRNFPLAFHPQAPLAHEAAMAAAKDGHFWEFANYILDHQDSLREQDLIAYAGRLGLEETKFAEIIRQHRYSPRVDADLAEGAKRGIRGSPVIFVNAKRIDGVPSMKTLTEYVETELAKRQP